eukprot:CAMPEP_0194203220 /NCGR_PEP_ID=MMETSP0156-20130528/3060_1 /TAXON_ID=33649 /ORGANISM="Thalassionema nitzschioides, Strain L26-B" /LENGTH=266 /DNA_ID=CAMNT_0038928927 /DNA_START=53 /DNA_END=853 /DNA_ORIENTATION=+
MAKARIVWTIILSIVAVTGLGFGAFTLVQGTFRSNTLEEVETSSYFQPATCTITDVSHRYETYQQTVGCGRGCSNYYVFCTDIVQYQFMIDDDDDDKKKTYYSSRKSRTVRNKQQIEELYEPEDLPDRCSTGTQYQGYLNRLNVDDPNGTNDTLTDEQKVLFVCDGLCANGTVVDCWAPTVTEGMSSIQEWAQCGNRDCIKLVDPDIELSLAEKEVEEQMNLGIVLVGAGVGATVLAAVIYFCCCRPKVDEVAEPSYSSSVVKNDV